jgi:hypothetical protein
VRITLAYPGTELITIVKSLIVYVPSDNITKLFFLSATDEQQNKLECLSAAFFEASKGVEWGAVFIHGINRLVKHKTGTHRSLLNKPDKHTRENALAYFGPKKVL